jgi:hypothetical protein
MDSSGNVIVNMVNDKGNIHRRKYWLMVSPFEKQILNKVRNNEINLTADWPKKKQEDK